MSDHTHTFTVPAPNERWRLKSRGLGKRGLNGLRVVVDFVHHCNSPRCCIAIVTVIDRWRKPRSKDSVKGERAVSIYLRHFQKKLG